MTASAAAGKIRKTSVGTVLQVRDLHVSFPSEAGPVHAVRRLSFDHAAGETMATVGESGSGNSVTSLAIIGLHPPSAYLTGSVTLHGEELLGRSDEAMSKLRGDALATTSQDPLSSLTPVYSVGDRIAKALQAQALALEPKMIVLDEPVLALNVSVQAGIINLLNELTSKLGPSYLFVAHDLAAIGGECDKYSLLLASVDIGVGWT